MNKNKNPLWQLASIPQEASNATARGGLYLHYSRPRSVCQERSKTVKKNKLKLVAALFCTMFFSVLAVACWLWPVVIPYVLAPFAVAGAWKFCRVAYIWMITDPVVNEEEEPW